jgi:hypothetical protein
LWVLNPRLLYWEGGAAGGSSLYKPTIAGSFPVVPNIYGLQNVAPGVWRSQLWRATGGFWEGISMRTCKYWSALALALTLVLGLTVVKSYADAKPEPGPTPAPKPEAYAVVTGKVVDIHGKPVVGAKVGVVVPPTLKLGPGEKGTPGRNVGKSVKTGADGIYTIDLKKKQVPEEKVVVCANDGNASGNSESIKLEAGNNEIAPITVYIIP